MKSKKYFNGGGHLNAGGVSDLSVVETTNKIILIYLKIYK